MNIRRLSMIALLLVLVLPMPILAHGNDLHVQGIVASISESSIVVRVGPHESKTVLLAPATKFEKVDAPATRADVKVGDRVVIHAGKKGQDLIAHVVRFAAGGPSGTAPRK